MSLIKTRICDDCKKPLNTCDSKFQSYDVTDVDSYDLCVSCLRIRVIYTIEVTKCRHCPACKGTAVEKEFTGVGSDHVNVNCTVCGGKGTFTLKEWGSGVPQAKSRT